MAVNAMLAKLPDRVIGLLRRSSVAEYATISAAGVPIDTPILYFPSPGLKSFDLATGLSYPAKAERARRNPKVGLFIEGRPDDPVISIAGRAAVRDSNLQANVERYLAEAGHTLPGNPDWAVARQAVWYWTRIIIEVTPACVQWWDNAAAMDDAPHRWDAPADTAFPQSDPPPPGTLSSPATWEQAPWPELAARALSRRANGYLSVVDDNGYPRPIRARAIARTDDGFRLEVPRGTPWSISGKACLTFQGIETFVGDVAPGNGAIRMKVARALPVFPMTKDLSQLWHPTPETHATLMRRLRHETERRGQPIPTIPAERPPPSESHKQRMAAGKAAPTPTEM